MTGEYTGFEMNGYDEDAPSSIVEIKKVEHHLNKSFSLQPIHSDNAHGNVFNQGQRNHNNKIVFSVPHTEHPQLFRRERHTYSK